jgi:hypothetical protein
MFRVFRRRRYLRKTRIPTTRTRNARHPSTAPTMAPTGRPLLSLVLVFPSIPPPLLISVGLEPAVELFRSTASPSEGAISVSESDRPPGIFGFALSLGDGRGLELAADPGALSPESSSSSVDVGVPPPGVASSVGGAGDVSIGGGGETSWVVPSVTKR